MEVTGSNIGIGFAIVRSLCKKLQSTDVVYLTSRSQTLGLEAVEKLKSEGLSPSYHQLDIADEGSTRRLKEHLEKTHGGVDILINNAGVLLRDNEIPFLEKVECTMKTNFYDTLKAYNILSPIIRPHGRVVFVSGGFGLRAYNQISEELKKSFREAKTEDDVQRLMGKFVSDVKAGNHIELGWLPGDDGNPPYSVSKLGIMAVTKVLAENLPKDPREGILINSCCPGYVATDLTENMGEKTVEEGAVTSVILALIPKGSSHPQGQYLDSYQQYQDFLTE